MVKVKLLTLDLSNDFNRVKRQLNKYRIEIWESKDSNEKINALIFILDGEMDFRVILTMSAIVLNCSKTLAFTKTSYLGITGIDNWNIIYNKFKLIENRIYKQAKTIVFIGDIDNQRKYENFRSTLGDNIKEDISGVYISHDYYKVLVITYNGDLNNDRFSSHEIEEDMIKFLEKINETGVSGRILTQKDVTDAKELYDKLNKSFRNFRLGPELFNNLDELLVHLMVKYREYSRKPFLRLNRVLELIANT
ncbi:hypothetical protein [Stygiolobus caldivivus]|uniref:Uncharacterized protein n=1 Tax=Stygiolobus caldivivus TaxID=2824673 RepID=A0A8D5U4B2_9CREN|nr:hypothetical protein [Stygiolobus caldivivus]BCU68840.1 hypothetical protein KN1_01370 [Stygiolobus caldivivus]